MLVDVADAPETGNFTSPAVLARGDLLVAVSTGGTSPVLARRIRDAIGEMYGSEYAQVLAIMGAVRQKQLTDSPNRTYNKRIFEQLADSDLPRLCRTADVVGIDRLLTVVAGSGSTLAELGITLKEPS